MMLPTQRTPPPPPPRFKDANDPLRLQIAAFGIDKNPDQVGEFLELIYQAEMVKAITIMEAKSAREHAKLSADINLKSKILDKLEKLEAQLNGTAG